MLLWLHIVKQSVIGGFLFERAQAELQRSTFLDQGFNNCFVIETRELINTNAGYLNAQRQLTIRVMLDLAFQKTPPPINHNPKLVTGMVGLENLGATCYLNALLQVIL